MRELKITLTTGQFIVFSWKKTGKDVRTFVRGPHRIGPGHSEIHEVVSFSIEDNKVKWKVRSESGKIEEHEASGIENIT